MVDLLGIRQHSIKIEQQGIGTSLLFSAPGFDHLVNWRLATTASNAFWVPAHSDSGAMNTM